MRFVSFRYGTPTPRVGVQLGDLVIDISAAAPLVFEDLDPVQWQLIDILQGEPQGMGIDGAAEIAAAVLDQLGVAPDSWTLDPEEIPGPVSIGGAEMVLPLSAIRLVAPLPRPTSLRAFDAFEDHLATTLRQRGRYVPPAWYEFPAFSFGNHSAILGPDAELPMPHTSELDYALEVACVIGRAGQDISEADAHEYIAGYMIMNDWTARDTQREELTVGVGPAKAKDFATSLGPALVTPDEIDHLALSDGRYNLTMIARVNSVETSRGNFRDIYYTFAQMIAYASRDTMLYPGDVLGSGTVGTGCLLELTAGAGPWLQVGDLVELDITGLGILRNRII